MSKRNCGHDYAESDSVLLCFPCEELARKQEETATWNAAIEAAAVALDSLATEHETKADAQHGKSRSEHDQRESMGGACRQAARRIRALKREANATKHTLCDSCHERPRGAGLSVCEPCAKAIYGRGREAP